MWSFSRGGNMDTGDPGDNDPYWYYDGRMAELIIFDQTLGDEEIENVERYLDAKFGTGS